MSFISQLLDKLKHLKSNKDTDSAQENYFDNEPNEFVGECFEGDNSDPADGAKTLKNKTILYGVGGIAALCAGLLLSNSLASNTAPTRNEGVDLSIPSTVNNPAASLPDSYKDIAKYDKQLKDKQIDDNLKQQMDKPTPPPPVVQPQQAPAYYPPPLPANNPSEEIKQRERDKILASPISFGIKVDPSTIKTTPTVAYSLPHTSVATHVIHAGTVIPATTLTGASSDVPNGDIVAMVRQDVYDSLSGKHLLIPQGAKLIGKSGSAGARGNKRLAVAFNRIIFPNGVSLDLPDQQGIDGPGFPGLKDKYDQHSSTLLRTAFLSALFSAGVQSATGNSNGTDNRSPGEEAVAGSVASILNTAQSIVNRDANLNPTVIIRPGIQFSVFINKDLTLGEYLYE